MGGTRYSAAVEPSALAVAAMATGAALVVALAVCRLIQAPISWYPRLAHGTPDERRNVIIECDGEALHWPDLDEDISVESIVAGCRSMESEKSLRTWITRRDQARTSA